MGYTKIEEIASQSYEIECLVNTDTSVKLKFINLTYSFQPEN